MKKLSATIFEIKRFAVHDGDGIRTTVFFKGCPLRCVWCHNPEGLEPKPQIAYFSHKCIGCGECARLCPTGAHSLNASGEHVFHREKCVSCGKCAENCIGEALTLYGKTVTVDELLPTLLEDREFYENSGGGVTLSGGECLMQADFCAELLKRLKENGINTAVDTCGFVPRSAVETVMPYTDIFLYDLKSYRSETHKKCTALPNEIILENLRYICESGKRAEIRIPYVPGYNDGEMDRISRFLHALPNITRVRILPYHSFAGHKYEALGIPDTLPKALPTDEEIKKAEALF